MIVVDLGNTRAKFGFFQNGYCANAVPVPDSVLAVDYSDFLDSSGWDTVIDWLDNPDKPERKHERETWSIARTGNFPWNELQTKLLQHRPHDQFHEISYHDIPIPIDVDYPVKVGLDRLLAVYASYCWRTFHAVQFDLEKETRILVVDAGSAITVDLLAGEGYFAGGAILPGLNAMAESLTKISTRLPRISTDDISFAVYPGKNTEEALAAGIYWGAIGAIRQFHQLVQTTLR
ncbi:MAG: type III pantothenate kinase, partial [Planctomycetaceae bacterium]|nr:type III pantothenate kinase [Planctomycetaceae bacterium]